MLEHSVSDEAEVVHAAEHHPIPYDENLLERARTQWQFGDWASLAKLDRDTLQHHPDRARLALLAVAGHTQQGDTQAARQFTRLAHDWGCSKKLISQILIAGVHNTLGRAAATTGEGLRALQHFETAIALGAPGNDIRLLTQARLGEQLAQLGLSVPPKHLAASTIKRQPANPFDFHNGSVRYVVPPTLTLDDADPAFADYSLLTEQFLKQLCARLQNGEESERQSALSDISDCLQNIAKDPKSLPIAMTGLTAHGQTFTFVHVAGDHIPRKIAEEERFYESKFLDLLRMFHDPGGLIIDGGANIGNHTIYFAKALEAEVIAIEPEPHNAICLAINVVLNNISDHVRLVRYALGQTPGMITLQMNVEANFGSFTGKADANPNSTRVGDAMQVQVPMITLDTALAEVVADKRISILKLDVEGMEVEALCGADKLIQTKLPLIAVECFSYADLTRVETQLMQYDYFPIEFANFTPTFIFVSRNNPFHLTRLADYLRTSAVERAMTKKGFGLR